MTQHNTIEEYAEFMEEAYADVESVEVNPVGDRVWVRFDHTKLSLGSHLTDKMLKHGFVVNTVGGREVEFGKVETNLEVTR